MGLLNPNFLLQNQKSASKKQDPINDLRNLLTILHKWGTYPSRSLHLHPSDSLYFLSLNLSDANRKQTDNWKLSLLQQLWWFLRKLRFYISSRQNCKRRNFWTSICSTAVESLFQYQSIDSWLQSRNIILRPHGFHHWGNVTECDGRGAGNFRMLAKVNIWRNNLSL
jgi:hypothetical protein